MTDKFQPQQDQSSSLEGAAGHSGTSSVSAFMFRLPEGSLPPPGYMLPPPAPRVGDKFQPQQARPFLSSAVAPAHVVWPVLMMPPGRAFRMEPQKGISREGGNDDKTTVSAASGVHTGRQKIPTVREKVYIDGDTVSRNAGALSPAFNSDTQTAHMDQSDSVDSHDPGASPSPVVPPGGPLAATNASYAGGSLAPAKSSGKTVPGKTRTREEMLKAEDKDELVGTTYLGKYELISVLGAGGMGVIYKARQVFLDRVLAIKMLKNKFASPKARMRFHQEAKAAAALNHPGIVAINDFGIDDEDRPYMVMEYVQGVTLADIVKMSPQSILPLREALPVFIEMLDPMAVAHSHGVVHRDIKPSNIMLALREDGTVQIKLLDFGIAKMRDLDDHTIQDLTKTGEALGTPLYMSPEQIKGTRVDSRADIYSFGCVMYMCLTGVPPFVGENKLHTMDKHVSEVPLTLKEASIGLDFPPELEACVMRCLAKEPEQRYQSSEALRRDLVAIACQLGMVKMPPGMVSPSESFLDDVASNPPLSEELAQAVTEFTSLELSTLCLTDPPAALERKAGGSSDLTVDAKSMGLTGSATRSQSQRNTVADLNRTGQRQLPVPYGSAGSSPGTRRQEIELAEDDAQEISYVDLEPSPWQRGRVRLFAALALLMVLGGSVSWYCLLGPGVHPAEDGKAKAAVDAPAVSQPPAPVAKPIEKDPLDDMEKEESGDEQFVKMIAAKPFMTRLEPRNLSVTDAAMPHVARLKFLEVFSLWDSKVTAKGLSYINKDKLGAFGLYSCSVDDAIIPAVLQFKNLTQVGFRDCKGITDSGAAKLAALKNLTTVDLAGTSVSNKTAAALAGMPRLLTVLLDDTNVDDAGLKQLCRNGSIIWLSLDKCKLSEAGLASLKNTPKLIKLSVSGCDVGDGFIDTLLSLKHLEVVNLSDTKITDKGLMRLSGRKQLKTINIAGCNVSAEAEDKFKKENPGVTVELSPFRGFYRAFGN
ncbi:MAG: protein kinase [Candidatus Melainabacteria bacterium]|nr:protein kinase [Candidatus Melainabacteria bacterium]